MPPEPISPFQTPKRNPYVPTTYTTQIFARDGEGYGIIPFLFIGARKSNYLSSQTSLYSILLEISLELVKRGKKLVTLYHGKNRSILLEYQTSA